MKIPSLNKFRLLCILAVACLLPGGHALRGQSSIVLEAFLTGKDAAGEDIPLHFPAGLSGDTLVLRSATQSGAACVFVREGTNWTQQAFLQASNRESGVDDGFGFADISGDTIVVAASGEDSNATGVNGNQANNSATDSGAAYVFERTGTTWTQVAYLKASNSRANALFGWSVAISGDTIVVGARLDPTRGFWAGAAYVFVRGQTGWTQQAVLYASNVGSDQFGGAVAISGNTIVVAAQYESSNATGVNGNQNNNNAQYAGAAYVFVRNGTTWTQQAYLKASNTETWDYFGSSVAISGDTIAVGAVGEDSDAAGVNGDQGNYGIDSLFNAGAVYVFNRSGTTWTQQAYLKSDSPNRNGQFGTAVATTGDFVIGGTYGFSGHELQVFVRQGTQWSSHARIDEFNSGSPGLGSQSIAASGDTMAAVNSVFRGLRVPEPPSLSISWADTGVRLSWPLSAADWVLEESSELELVPGWSVILPPYDTDAAGYFFSIPDPSGSRFFRLRKP